MEETRTPGPRSQNKKIANHEWRVPSTGLCGTTLCAKEGRRERFDIRRGLCQSSKDIARMLCPNKRGRTVKSRQEGWG